MPRFPLSLLVALAPLFASTGCSSCRRGPDLATDADPTAPIAGELIFVGRSQATEATRRGKDEVDLTLHQEAFRYDLATRQARPLTDTSGRVYAIALDPRRRFLSFVTVGHMSSGRTVDTVFDAEIGGLDLASGEKAGPVPIGAETESVDLVFAAGGEPLWLADMAMWSLDRQGKRLVRGMMDLKRIDPRHGRTLARPALLRHFGNPPIATQLSADTFAVEVETREVFRTTVELDTHSLAWSPRRRRLAFAAAFDHCREGSEGGLWIHDATARTTRKVASGRSRFTSQWLDDERLVYEAADGLHLVAPASDQLLPGTAGASLYGSVIPPCSLPAE